ncbi:MAG: S8 family serine peptidase [Bacteroidales bacterium]|nr:S8 family serine peptidase [Bacteroidales bacterium]
MKIFISGLLLLLTLSSMAQQKYWVYLKDKDTTGYNPYTFFDQKAIERRVRNDIPIYHISDVPVNQSYVAVLDSKCDSLSYASRWFNAVCLYATDVQISEISELDFVTKIELSGSIPSFCSIEEDEEILYPTVLSTQVTSMQGQMFHDAGYRGEGIRIAIFDGGFPKVDELDCFKHIRDNNRIIKTYDFAKKTENVYHGSSHGTTVLSCIAGLANDSTPIGLATNAEFLLARTEIGLEPFSEEENWLAALEWADKNGADIVNSSLGYTVHRYFTYDMDGQTAFVSRAANTAASKGILVVNAAGNEGTDKDWKIIGAPADADSILSIGGVEPYSLTHINFSSYGPTADGRLKPNVCAFGQVTAQGKKKMGTHYGTSFASPLVAGFAACALQTDRDMTAMELFAEIQHSASLYPYYDYAHGYGIPQASYFLGIDTDTIHSTIEMTKTGADIEIEVSPLVDELGHVVYVYVHLSDADGKLIWYVVLTANENPVFKMSRNALENGTFLRVHYAGLTKEFKLK